MSEEPLQFRSAAIESGEVDEDARTVQLSFSSEQPVERSFGVEVLEHTEDAVDLSRLEGGAPLLLEHDRGQQVGVVEKAWIDEGDRKGRATVRFSRSVLGEEIFNDVRDGIRRLVSVGYRVNTFLTEKADEGLDTLRAVSWEPLEVSLVSIPADQSVGVGRADDQNDTQLEKAKEHKMETVEETRTESTEQPKPEIQVVERPDKRAKEIAALGKQYDAQQEAIDFITANRTADEFKTHLIETRHNAEPIEVKQGDDEIGMSRNECREYSLTRAILAASEQRLDGIELEASRELENRFGQPAKGFYVPNDVFKRDLTATGGDTGDKMVETGLGEFIPALSAQPVVVQLGARVMSGLSGNVSLPQGGTATAYWVAENADTTESTQTLAQVSLTPKRVAALSELSKQLLVQASYDVEAIVRDDIALQLSLAIDAAAISGAGADDPTGIINTSGIGAETFSSAFTHANVVDVETDVGTAKALSGSLAYLMSPSGRGSLKKTTLDSGSGRFLMEGNELNGYRAEASAQCPADTLIFGDWSQVVVAEFGAGADIVVDPYTKAATGLTRLIVSRFADVGLRHAASFSVCQ